MVNPEKSSVDKFAYQDNVDILQSRATTLRYWCEDNGGSFTTIENEDEMVVGECQKKGNRVTFEGKVFEDESQYSGVGRSTQVTVNGVGIDGRIEKDGDILKVGDKEIGADMSL